MDSNWLRAVTTKRTDLWPAGEEIEKKKRIHQLLLLSRSEDFSDSTRQRQEASFGWREHSKESWWINTRTVSELESQKSLNRSRLSGGQSFEHYQSCKTFTNTCKFSCLLSLCTYSSYLITQKCWLRHGLEFVGSLKKFVFVSFTSVSRIGARSQAGHTRIDYSPELNLKSSALLWAQFEKLRLRSSPTIRLKKIFLFSPSFRTIGISSQWGIPPTSKLSDTWRIWNCSASCPPGKKAVRLVNKKLNLPVWSKER